MGKARENAVSLHKLGNRGGGVGKNIYCFGPEGYIFFALGYSIPRKICEINPLYYIFQRDNIYTRSWSPVTPWNSWPRLGRHKQSSRHLSTCSSPIFNLPLF